MSKKLPKGYFIEGYESEAGTGHGDDRRGYALLTWGTREHKRFLHKTTYSRGWVFVASTSRQYPEDYARLVETAWALFRDDERERARLMSAESGTA